MRNRRWEMGIGSKKTIIWYFNGTLIDDTQVCVDCMNSMLAERGLPYLEVHRYREIFTFPVKEYYLELGFDFDREPFEIPAHQFIDLYRDHLHRAPLQDGIMELLIRFDDMGFRQVVLSAMEQEFLTETLKAKGIFDFFEKVMGITNHLGEGKQEMALEMLNWLDQKADSVCIIGDSIHDYEVARDLGIDCILLARGHQSFERLEKLECIVLRDFQDLIGLFRAS